MASTNRQDERPREPRRVSVEQLGAETDRASGLMMLAMIACCAAVPLVLIVAVLTGAVTVSGWSWVLLAAAAVAAGAMIVRVGWRR